MTIVFDASALVALQVEGVGRRVVTGTMENDAVWAATATALPEAIAGAARLVDDDSLARAMEDMLRRVWDYLHVVPVDQSLLDAAADLCRRQPVGMSAAMHLAGAVRLPAPVRFVTFDASQIPVALSLGLDVVSG